MRKKIVLVTGIRPNIVKAFSLYHELINHKEFDTTLIHTDQHFDKEMFELLWQEFKLPNPILLKLKYNNIAERFGSIVIELSKELNRIKPDLVFVYGLS